MKRHNRSSQEKLSDILVVLACGWLFTIAYGISTSYVTIPPTILGFSLFVAFAIGFGWAVRD